MIPDLFFIGGNMEEIKELLQRIIDTLERIEKKLPDCRTVKTTIAIGGDELRDFTRNAH